MSLTFRFAGFIRSFHSNRAYTKFSQQITASDKARDLANLAACFNASRENKTSEKGRGTFANIEAEATTFFGGTPFFAAVFAFLTWT